MAGLNAVCYRYFIWADKFWANCGTVRFIPSTGCICLRQSCIVAKRIKVVGVTVTKKQLLCIWWVWLWLWNGRPPPEGCLAYRIMLQLLSFKFGFAFSQLDLTMPRSAILTVAWLMIGIQQPICRHDRTSCVVIISITRYCYIDRRLVQRTISWRPLYRTISCTNARLARALLTYRSGGVCVWLMSLAVHTGRGSLCLTFPAVDLSCSALGAWGGDWGTAVAPVVS